MTTVPWQNAIALQQYYSVSQLKLFFIDPTGLAITCNEIVFKGAQGSCNKIVVMKPVRVFLYPYCEASQGNSHPEMFKAILLDTDLAKINEKVYLHVLFQRRPELALPKPQFRTIQRNSGPKGLCSICCDKPCWVYGAFWLRVYVPSVTMKCKQSKQRSRPQTEDLQCIM